MMESEECSRTPRLRRRQCGEATQPAEAELHHTCKQAQRMMVMRHVSLVTSPANPKNACNTCTILHIHGRIDANFVLSCARGRLASRRACVQDNMS
ncbi:hypothetical protein [Xanthomonas oryzae]|uniref:hypothetical protein n=1 Tax=Xanthomonas oryzae TaxID=347 RepID=UPI00065AAF42|nr:hypothetical protein [Xanthomonas oryzae]QQD50554.1 hypothetical protein BXO512_006005 [Xanthomonas oryzae pv. oryzae]UEQ20645.1 hypothetical protein KFK26_05100 [Xanthomonas oryzae]UXV83866.1 hypothetical protein IXO35_019065 [Xanthomonas oryzae pv. oryzae]UXV87693.1 hypothetical protein IXO134_019420 [Xanthomonas oryzae pv. oryzae]UXV94835.1 hypothetical protein IXO74_017245 [Xanthomonas oryzae pv. oryzae]